MNPIVTGRIRISISGNCIRLARTDGRGAVSIEKSDWGGVVSAVEKAMEDPERRRLRQQERDAMTLD